tara:strand:- start:280 stop:792 length:513 start_codon:yes stop_codon:yes gene_type:complete
MIVDKLIKIVKDNSLISDSSDVKFLFLDYVISDKTIPIETLIEDVIKWGYENDELEDFYLEHIDFFIDTEIVTSLINCTMDFATSVPTYISYDMYCFESNNLYYYKVIGEGYTHESWETSYGFYEILEKNSNTDIIDMFKCECENVYTTNNEFDADSLSSDGHSIEYHKY